MGADINAYTQREQTSSVTRTRRLMKRPIYSIFEHGGAHIKRDGDDVRNAYMRDNPKTLNRSVFIFIITSVVSFLQ